MKLAPVLRLGVAYVALVVVAVVGITWLKEHSTLVAFLLEAIVSFFYLWQMEDKMNITRRDCLYYGTSGGGPIKFLGWYVMLFAPHDRLDE